MVTAKPSEWRRTRKEVLRSRHRDWTKLEPCQERIRATAPPNGPNHDGSSGWLLNCFKIDFAVQRRAPTVHQLHCHAGPSFTNLPRWAPEQQGALMFRIVLQDRHDEDEALEVSKRNYSIDIEMPVLVARLRNNYGGKRERK